jgi:hypothetical protein
VSPEVWVPGSAEPSLDDFVQRLLAHIERFAKEQAGGEATVEVELRDGSTFPVLSIMPEPGYGFVTLAPHREGEEPEELVVPVGAIARIRLSKPEQHPPFGFSRSASS